MNIRQLLLDVDKAVARPSLLEIAEAIDKCRGVEGAVAELVGIEVGVVSGVINLESSGVEASDWRLRHEQAYHEARFLAACD